MRVSYQHANPHSGRESTLLKFHDEVQGQTTCVLVDAGEDVDVDDLLGEDEYLTAVLLTHAHLDHYRTLGTNLRDGAPIYATPETASAITTRLETGTSHADITDAGAVREALEPVHEWTTVSPDVRVHPVPAGHAPGACGFVLEFSDGDDRHHVLATGDFTERRAAGYPGMQTDVPADAVLLTGATNEDAGDALTDAVATAVRRARAGSTTLATASASTGVHLAYLVAAVAERDSLPVPVTLAGRVATLWDAFGYDHPGVESVPTFDAPDDVLEPGAVTIAGPATPVAGSSERLFGALADDAGATLVQVTSGALEPVRSARCSVYDAQVSNHPDEATVDSVVEQLQPIHVVVTHQQGAAADRYKDRYDSFVWATDDTAAYTLYDDGEWVGPPWVTEATRRRVRASRYGGESATIGLPADATDLPLPTVTRHEEVDLAAEGVDVDRLADALDLDAGVFESGPTADRGDATPDETTPPSESGSDRGLADAADQDRVEGCPDTAATETERSEGVTELLARLDRIEAELTGRRTRATVVDAGDDVTMLRLADNGVATALDHGEVVDVSVRPVEETPDGDGEPDGST
ncbi:MAG: MBL fold metallo-hydrolase [Halobacteriaceae archaeon]